MIQVTLPDGSVKEFESGTTPFDVANSISAGLARNVISAKYNNKTIEITTPLTEDGALVLFTWNDDEGKKAFWHSSAHILAQALEELYPGVKLTIGPAIDKGFYYDVDLGDRSLSENDFKKIENKMLEFIRELVIVWGTTKTIKKFYFITLHHPGSPVCSRFIMSISVGYKEIALLLRYWNFTSRKRSQVPLFGHVISL